MLENQQTQGKIMYVYKITLKAACVLFSHDLAEYGRLNFMHSLYTRYIDDLSPHSL